MTNIGPISLLHSDNNEHEPVLFVGQISPPLVYEVNIKDIMSPYIQRIYNIKEDYN